MCALITILSDVMTWTQKSSFDVAISQMGLATYLWLDVFFILIILWYQLFHITYLAESLHLLN